MPFRKIDGDTIWVTPEEEEEQKRIKSELSDIQYAQEEYESQPVNILTIKELNETLKITNKMLGKIMCAINNGVRTFDPDNQTSPLQRREE
jgi:hypothetical protein